jgi:hypothetical protein
LAVSTSGKTLTRFPKQEKFGKSGKVVAPTPSDIIGAGALGRVQIASNFDREEAVRQGRRLSPPGMWA